MSCPWQRPGLGPGSPGIDISPFLFSFFQLKKDLLCRYYVYRVMPSTHHSSSYVDPGYRGTGGKTGKWGSSFWEKTLPTCTIMTQPGWDCGPQTHRTQSLGCIRSLGLPVSFLLGFSHHFLFTFPLLFLLPSSSFSSPLSRWRWEVLGFGTSISSRMKENIAILSFIWSTQHNFFLVPMWHFWRNSTSPIHCSYFNMQESDNSSSGPIWMRALSKSSHLGCWLFRRGPFP